MQLLLSVALFRFVATSNGILREPSCEDSGVFLVAFEATGQNFREHNREEDRTQDRSLQGWVKPTVQK